MPSSVPGPGVKTALLPWLSPGICGSRPAPRPSEEASLQLPVPGDPPWKKLIKRVCLWVWVGEPQWPWSCGDCSVGPKCLALPLSQTSIAAQCSACCRLARKSTTQRWCWQTGRWPTSALRTPCSCEPRRTPGNPAPTPGREGRRGPHLTHSISSGIGPLGAWWEWWLVPQGGVRRKPRGLRKVGAHRPGLRPEAGPGTLPWRSWLGSRDAGGAQSRPGGASPLSPQH